MRRHLFWCEALDTEKWEILPGPPSLSEPRLAVTLRGPSLGAPHIGRVGRGCGMGRLRRWYGGERVGPGVQRCSDESLRKIGNLYPSSAAVVHGVDDRDDLTGIKVIPEISLATWVA